jgi:hypothetical protein
MHDFTNLQWPTTPLGAEQRPFGRHWDMLAACTIEWTEATRDDPTPIAATMVYLRVRKHGSAHHITADTLSIGFRTMVIEQAAEVSDLLAVTDEQLTGARRLGVILAGHHLIRDLTRMNHLAIRPLRGVAEVSSAWAEREVRRRGIAAMVDTAADVGDLPTQLDMAVETVPVETPTCPACAAKVARYALARCLAVALTAAVYSGRYTWEDTFPVNRAVDAAAWDIVSDRDHSGTCPSRTSNESPAGSTPLVPAS